MRKSTMQACSDGMIALALTGVVPGERIESSPVG